MKKKATIAKLLVICLIVSMMGMSIAAYTREAPETLVTGATYTMDGDTYTVTVSADVTFTAEQIGADGTYEISLDSAGVKLTTTDVAVEGTVTVKAGEVVLYEAKDGVTLSTEVYYTSGSAFSLARSGETITGGGMSGDVTLTAAGAEFKYLTVLNPTHAGLTVAAPGLKLNGPTTSGEYTVWTASTNTSGGGGGGGGATANVSVPSTNDGKVSVDNTNAKEGDTVTITVTPNPGKKVDSVTVTTADGKTVTVTDIGNNKYTFVMPKGKVTVKVTFVDDAAEKPVFADIPADAYYADAVAWAVENGITNGTSETTFSPNASCTRAQMVTFLWRLAGSPKAEGTNPFADVAADSYYYDAVMWAVANGITNGTGDATFSPDATVSRAQSVTFLYRYAGEPEAAEAASFADVAADAYYAPAVAWAAANGITNGTTETTFSPDNACVRAQIVTFMYRYAVEE